MGHIIRTLTLFLFLVGTVNGQGWADDSTNPTGVTNISIPTGSSNDPSISFISSAYNQDPAYAGMIDVIEGSTLTLSDFDLAGYSDNELTQSAHLLRITDGNADGQADVSSTVNGQVFAVISHVGNEITINLPETQMDTYFALYDSVEIIKATTLESLFGVGDDFVGVSGKPSTGDNILVWNSSGWKVYFHYNNKWQTFGTRSDQSSTIIYPDEGMVYVRRDDAFTLSFSGLVPLSVQSYVPAGGEKFLMANPFPTEKTISQLINTDGNWLSDTSYLNADQVLFWTGSSWAIYYHNGDDWVNVITSEVDDKAVDAGEAFFIIRANYSTSSHGYNKIDLF
jgi:hypothetical protein